MTSLDGRCGGRRESFPTGDASRLRAKYKDHIWAENARIDRLSICQLGVTGLGGGINFDATLSEVFSVPLP